MARDEVHGDIVCVIIANQSLNVLLTRYFHAMSEAEKAEWESELKALTAEALQEVSPEDEQIAATGTRKVVFTLVGDIYLFLTGTDGADELGLLEHLRSLAEVLQLMCRKSVSEAAIIANYGKVVPAMDEMFINEAAALLPDLSFAVLLERISDYTQGFVDTTNAEAVEKLVKCRE